MLSLVSKTEATVRSPRRRRSVSPLPPGDIVTGRVLGDALSSRWQAFAEQLLRTQRRPTEKAVHDLRVSTRRLIALLDIIREILPEPDTLIARRRMKRLLTALSEFRDVHVQIIMVRSLVRSFPVLDLYLTVLLVRERIMLKRVRKELGTVQVRALERKLNDGRVRLEEHLLDPAIGDAVHRMIMGILARRYSRAAVLRADAMTGNPGSIHRFRIAFKQFRYTVEALKPLIPGVEPRMLKTMGAFQTGMGAIQDCTVLISSVKSHVARQRRLALAEHKGVMAHLGQQRDQLIRKFISSAGELDAFWRALNNPGR